MPGPIMMKGTAGSAGGWKFPAALTSLYSSTRGSPGCCLAARIDRARSPGGGVGLVGCPRRFALDSDTLHMPDPPAP